jgi:hypothetical protein
MIKDQIETYIDYDHKLIKDIARQAIEVENKFQSKMINRSEYEELMSDIKSQTDVSLSMKDLAVKESLNKLIDALITAATLV